MEHAELDRIGEIDRSEEISQDHLYQDGGLHLKDVHWSVPRWRDDGLTVEQSVRLAAACGADVLDRLGYAALSCLALGPIPEPTHASA